MNVKYYTAFQRVVHHIKTTTYTIDNGADALVIVFNFPAHDIYAQLREALE